MRFTGPLLPAASPQVLGGQLVTDLKPGVDGRSIGTVVARDVATGQTNSYSADAVVFAIGITGMQKLVQQCRILGDRQEFRNVMNLRAIDVIATRLWWVDTYGSGAAEVKASGGAGRSLSRCWG